MRLLLEPLDLGLGGLEVLHADQLVPFPRLGALIHLGSPDVHATMAPHGMPLAPLR